MVLVTGRARETARAEETERALGSERKKRPAASWVWVRARRRAQRIDQRASVQGEGPASRRTGPLRVLDCRRLWALGRDWAEHRRQSHIWQCRPEGSRYPQTSVWSMILGCVSAVRKMSYVVTLCLEPVEWLYRANGTVTGCGVRSAIVGICAATRGRISLRLRGNNSHLTGGPTRGCQ